MLYHLVFHLDQDGYKGIILKTFNNLKEMDAYIQENFNNREDVLKEYNEEISEFCLDERKTIEYENKRNNHNRLGAITLFFEYNHFYKKIPIIYKNDHKLLSDELCLKKIEESLQDDIILDKLLKTKKYLLSDNEVSLIDLYYKFPYDIQKKQDAIIFFINRLKNLNERSKYFYFRCLMNLCRLNKIDLKISKGKIQNIDINIPNKFQIIKEQINNKIDSTSEDEFFNRLISEEDYEEIFNLYGIDIIERDTNFYKK